MVIENVNALVPQNAANRNFGKVVHKVDEHGYAVISHYSIPKYVIFEIDRADEVLIKLGFNEEGRRHVEQA